MDQTTFIHGLLEFIAHSPTSYHAVQNMAAILTRHGFTRLDERTTWQPGQGRYFVIRDHGSLIGFILGGKIHHGLRMAGAHTDSPGLKLKPNPVRTSHHYLQLTAEVYGSPLLSTWFDRELSIAGRVIRHCSDNRLQSSLIDLQTPVAVMPSLAIHLVNKERKEPNRQTALIPLLQTWDDTPSPDLDKILQGCQPGEQMPGELAGFDLFFYDCQPPVLAGSKQEFISGPRLDNLISCYCLVQALAAADSAHSCLISCHDHEEVGSGSASGAASSFLPDVLARLIAGPQKLAATMQCSVFLSVDNAHGVHPNFADEHDPQHQPVINQGPVIKVNANQRYATSGRTSALFRQICGLCQVEPQEFVMRNDKGCGSTIGPVLSRLLGVQVADIGVPTLAMHSIRELAGQEDCWSMYRCLRTFFQGVGALP